MKRIILTSWIALAGMLGAQDMPLSQVLIPGEDWRLASFRHEFTDAPTADAKGNFYFSDLRSEQGLYQICLLYTSPSPRDVEEGRMPCSA